MKKGLKAPILFGVIIGVIFAIIFGYTEIQSIQRSTISTASAGYLFMPIGCVVVFLITGGLGFVFAMGLRKLTGSGRYRYLIGFSMILLPLLVLGYGAWYFGSGLQAEQRVKMLLSMRAPELSHQYKMLTHGKKSPFYVFELAAIAQNSKANGALLDKIAHNPDPVLDAKLGSAFNLLGNNSKGLSVRRLVVANPNVESKTLVYLAHNSYDNYLLGDIAANKKTPISVLRMLYKKDGYLVEWGLASNPHTPKDILKKLANSQEHFGAQYTRQRIANNPSTPTQTLKLLAKDQALFVSQAAKQSLKKRGY